jgi:hypothetical protein
MYFVCMESCAIVLEISVLLMIGHLYMLDCTFMIIT